MEDLKIESLISYGDKHKHISTPVTDSTQLEELEINSTELRQVFKRINIVRLQKRSPVSTQKILYTGIRFDSVGIIYETDRSIIKLFLMTL